MNFLDIIKYGIDFIVHMDEYLAMIIDTVGIWTYLVLFFVIFIETGFVVTPFLPGDSLLFAVGAFSALGSFNPFLVWGLLFLAAVLGDTANYWIGHYIGPKVFSANSRWIKQEYLERTQAFYEKHGGKTIFLARFLPIIRTFAPFVAGVGKMRYGYFITYNFLGGFAWTALFIAGGYFFGNIPVVRDNFSLVIIALVLIPGIPALLEAIKARQTSKAKAADVPPVEAQAEEEPV
jgi:membrane-associated protein